MEIDGRTVLSVYSAVAGFTPEERAAHIQTRILGIAQRRDLGLDLIHTEDRSTWTDVLSGDQIIMGVTEYDARIAGRPRAQLATEYAEIIRQVIQQYRQEHTWRNTLRAAGYSALATSGLFLLLLILLRLYRLITVKLRGWNRSTGAEEQLKSVHPEYCAFSREDRSNSAECLAW